MPSFPGPDSMPARIVGPDQRVDGRPTQPPVGRHNRAPFRNPQQPGSRSFDIDKPNAGFQKKVVAISSDGRTDETFTNVNGRQVRLLIESNPAPLQERATQQPPQRQQSEQRVPFGDRFPAGVGAFFDGQRWVSTGSRNKFGDLIFIPQGGGAPKAIDAYMLQVKGAFPLAPETQASAPIRSQETRPQPQAPRAPESSRRDQVYPFTKYEHVVYRGKRFIVRDGLDSKRIALVQHLPERPDDTLIIEHTTREELMKEGNNPIPLNVRMETVNTPKDFDAAMAAFAGVQGKSEFLQSAQQRKAAAEFFRTGEGDSSLTSVAGIREAAHRVRRLMFVTR